ncbi:hypothetical protein DPEC_G00052890 [Dallia pectoralis]|uniref:Uncharacterized protein n=1 Tax=Dallia pectoralis TaxID=75939 RepID=A0ACC2HC26_DALPE|nr:hypothetical protein DPEC_G00052890 [Dallia pectoralis]
MSNNSHSFLVLFYDKPKAVCNGHHRYHLTLPFGCRVNKSPVPLLSQVLPLLYLKEDGKQKNKQKEFVRSQQKDILKEQPSQNGWCDTPKVSKREISLRRRLLMSKSATEEEFSIGALATSTLKQEDLLLSGRKRRFLFSHVKTSTLDEDKCNLAQLPLSGGSLLGTLLTDDDLDESIISSDHSTSEIVVTPSYSRLTLSTKENFQTPVNDRIATNLSDSLSVLCTPSLTPNKHHHDNSISEDSGFSSLAIDKSQDSSVDQDGSFQELLLSSGGSRGKDIPSRLTEMTKRRSRLEHQRRLSTLREGGSQSDEGDRVAKPQAALRSSHQEKNLVAKEQPLHVSKEDEVFLDVTPLKTATDKLEDLFLTPALQMVRAFSQRTSRMLLEQTSLEELLRASESAALCTTMPLAGLIGRKMGVGRVDILSELMKRNLRHVLVMVLNHLSPEDIYRVGQVSNSWNEIIAQNKTSSRKRRQYLKNAKALLELGSAVRVPDAETRLNLSSRSALRSVQAQSRTPSSTRTPQSGTSAITQRQQHLASRQDAFLQVAKTLFNDESLKACPRCQQPARCHSVKGEGVCTRADCGFQFCTGCLCAFHGSKECASLSAKRRGKKDVLPGSAQSKRNVRRL